MATITGKTLKNIICDQRYLALWVVAALIVPNAVLPFTEGWPAVESIAGILVPAGIYTLILSASRRTGITTWCLLPVMILSAFQLVLLYLYHRGLIGVDMFLNVFTTSFSEATTLLRNLVVALAVVVLLYVTPLVWGTYTLTKHIRLSRQHRRHMFYAGTAISAAGIVTSLAVWFNAPDYDFADTTFPLNVTDNLITAINRTDEFANYEQTSANFSYNGISTAPAQRRELYIIVIGETSRAENWQLNGYRRPTNPHLMSEKGLTNFPKAFSESNTTHKSVPMLISAASATSFDSIYCYKSIISAFKDAGYQTAFFSNQTPNRSYTQFFGNEAHNVKYVPETATGIAAADTELLPLIRNQISQSNLKQLIVVHTYGSHFLYSDRYPASEAYFKPDDVTDADAAFRKELINAYDNSIRQTDLTLHEIISLAREAGCRAAVIYASDHGEDIFDDNRNLFLHASPVPSARQLHVGACCWLSDSLDAQSPEASHNLKRNHRKFISPQKSVFHTIIDLAQISTPYFRDDKSLVSETYTEPTPLYVTDRNEALPWSQVKFQQPDYDYFKKHAAINIAHK